MDEIFKLMDEAEEWFDDNSWLIPDDGGFECFDCKYWVGGEGCGRHMNGKNCCER